MVTCYSAGAASASEAVRAFWIDGGTTRTLMWLAQFGSEAQTDGESDGLVVQAETA